MTGQMPTGPRGLPSLTVRGVLVTGTDTGVGKTVVAAQLCRGRPDATYVKPAQTGLATDEPDAAVVARLAGVAVRTGPAFDEALAPAVAARRAGVERHARARCWRRSPGWTPSWARAPAGCSSSWGPTARRWPTSRRTSACRWSWSRARGWARSTTPA